MVQEGVELKDKGNEKFTTPGPSNLNQKSFLKILITFGDKYPRDGSKNEPMAPRTNLG